MKFEIEISDWMSVVESYPETREINGKSVKVVTVILAETHLFLPIPPDGKHYEIVDDVPLVVTGQGDYEKKTFGSDL